MILSQTVVTGLIMYINDQSQPSIGRKHACLKVGIFIGLFYHPVATDWVRVSIM